MWAATPPAAHTQARARPPPRIASVATSAAATHASAARGRGGDRTGTPNSKRAPIARRPGQGGGPGGGGGTPKPARPAAPPTRQPGTAAGSASKAAAAAKPAKPAAPPPATKAAPKPAPTPATPDPRKEAHKLFDEVVLRVRAGRGGRGEVAKPGAGRVVKNFKYAPGGRRGGREVFLPAAPPADGGPGGDVVVRADAGLSSLLHLHGGPAERAASDGPAGNPARGTAGPRRTASASGLAARAAPPGSPLILDVPVGTVVRRGPGGPVIGEVLRHGATVLVARGGAGGPGVVGGAGAGGGGGARARRRRGGGGRYVFDEPGDGDACADVPDLGGDPSGAPGEALTVHLLLRVVADVGLVGAPNAGKSSLLGALTAARPEVGAHPFTTLMPNLGVLAASVAAGGDADAEADRSLGLGPQGGPAGPPPVLADLPGLLPGAHAGRGLGRAFLRHARRAAALLHVVDAAGVDPVGDYTAIRREIVLYNPDYAGRPHVVALNKTDLLDGASGGGGGARTVDDVVSAFRAALAGAEHPPLAIVPTSAAAGVGLTELAGAVEEALKAAKEAEGLDWKRRA